MREYLAEKSSARRDVDALARLIGGAASVRRVARLLQDAHQLAPLAPLDSHAPWVAEACGVFDAEWRSRRAWFERFGAAIASAADPPAPEPGAPSRAGEATSQLASQAGPAVVLDPSDGDDGGIPPGLAIAWTERFLQFLLELEPPLSAAAESALEEAPA
jgi:hypothetical protein